MIGFITTKEQADAANAAITKAQTDRGLPVFWLLGSCPIYQGEYAGSQFIQCDSSILSTPLIGNPVQTPQDFHELTQIIEQLGGLNSIVELDPEAIIQK